MVVNNVVNASNEAMVSDVVTANSFKETVGYVQANWKMFNTLGMKMYIEKAPIGNYRYVLKGKLITLAGLSEKAKTIKIPVGSPKAEYLGANNTIRGRTGLGGFKRISFTIGSNLKAGMKIGAIGTVIDLYGDVVTVFGKDGSKDASEFLGRAGVSILKAGATAALGGIFVAMVTGVIGLIFSVTMTLPVLATVGIIVGGYILAATAVDYIDSYFNLKNNIANGVR